MTAIEDNIFQYVLTSGGTDIPQIVQWGLSVGLNEFDMQNAIKAMLADGRIYYVRKGLIIANVKKAGNLPVAQPQQVQQQQAPQQQANRVGGGYYRPPGVDSPFYWMKRK